MRRLPLVGFVVSAALVVAVGYPWGEFVGHTHWSKVAWVPFTSDYDRLPDEAGNLLLFVPLGIFAALAFKRGITIAGTTALAVSCFVEWMQLYTHTRFPSATDVVCNVAGAVVAAAVVGRTRRRGSLRRNQERSRSRLARR